MTKINKQLSFFKMNLTFKRNIDYKTKMKIDGLCSERRLSIDKLNETFHKESRSNILDRIFRIDTEIEKLKPHEMHVFLTDKNGFREIVDYKMENCFSSISDFWTEYR